MKSRHVAVLIVALALSSIFLGIGALPAAAEYPPAVPTVQGEIYDWGTGDARECFVALSPMFEVFLVWVPIDCGDFDSQNNSSLSSLASVHVGLYTSRIEIWKSNGRLRSGADTVSVVNGQKYTVPAGWLANAQELFKWNGSNWVSKGNTGYQYNASPKHTFSPTKNWGFPGRNAWYYTQGYSYLLTYGGWITTNTGSGSISIPAAPGLAAVPAVPPPPGPPEVNPIPPPSAARPFGR